ncbi:hypothetical protein E0485_11435 [Paenibacillus albiflavus]|uniref:Uncharacterized protein n=1 Tax=Paenibacillus albiflavus TaxID=2545760 RepID=A0A4V2WNW8_9BACL|nr:hypothetical protein [Paenibacillus albiflavus]TCZ77072.1 hypothetical protein E0485_11435 [Paenibacillus albiflavus]
MREIVRVECKRILNIKTLGLILIIVLAISIFSSVNNFTSYNLYDSSGKVVLSAKDNLAESKKSDHNKALDSEALMDVINGVDKSNYLYNMNTIRVVLSTYNEKHISEMTKEDMDHFYEQRIAALETGALRPLGIFTDEQIEHLLSKASQLEAPMQVGYAEGWKNLNNDMADLLVIILMILSVILLPVFGGTAKTNMNELCLSTKHGKSIFIKAKMIAGLEITSLVYVASVFILTIAQLSVFGTNGYNLVIQSDVFYLFSTYNITFLEQYILNVVMGYTAVLFMTSIIFLITVITEQIIAGGVLTTFFWIMMFTLPSNLFTSVGITHNLSNFLPYNMTNFNKFFRNNEIYEVFGQMIPSYLWVMIVTLVITACLTVATNIVADLKISKKFEIITYRK